jgi:1-acyl-sn-glycerol-3-phosphate acyltransferase
MAVRQTSPVQGGAGPALDRDSLVAAMTALLENQSTQELSVFRRTLEQAVEEFGPEPLISLGERLARAGGDWTYYPPDPLARRIHLVLADKMLEPDSTLTGAEHLAAVADRPVVVFPNHLSYSDANLFEILLSRAGERAFADRLTVIAGPKVYSSLKRRLSSLCFGTIKTPQSSALSSEEAVMTAREVARAARRSIDSARERLRRGDALLVFAEGTRSRTRGMQRLLTGVTRYLDDRRTWVLPVGITGTDALFPIGEVTVHRVRVVAHVGRPIDAGILSDLAAGERRLMMDVVGLAIAGLLPPEYRGAYADPTDDLDHARRLAADLAL